MTSDERLQIRDARIAFTNDQNAGRSQIKMWFEEIEEKPSVLTFQIPNPYATRAEMIEIMKRRINRVSAAIEQWEKEAEEILDNLT